MDKKVKSVTTILTPAGWAVRLRTEDGREFVQDGGGYSYTKHQAQTLAQSILRDIANHGIDLAMEEMREVSDGK